MLNGSGIEGAATDAAAELSAAGFNVIGVDNAETSDFISTIVRYDPLYAEAARTVAASIPGATRVLQAGLGTTIEVVVGEDWPGVTEVVVKKPPKSACEPPTRTSAPRSDRCSYHCQGVPSTGSVEADRLGVPQSSSSIEICIGAGQDSPRAPQSLRLTLALTPLPAGLLALALPPRWPSVSRSACSLQDLVDRAVRHDPAAPQIDPTRAQSLQLPLAVRDQEHGLAARQHGVKSLVCLALERTVADRQGLVDDDRWFVQRGDERERHPRLHAAGQVTKRRVDEVTDLGELDDVVELALNLGLAPCRAGPATM